ncbi:carboxyl transferase domain-containing protein [Pusillimonas sp.]|uniref:carboxyl transferase domain-containing protein n=1 Tax=Pusillimonas sp. TaxID=3040095 RepID=UPI0037C6F659
MTNKSGGDTNALDEAVLNTGNREPLPATRSLTAQERLELLFDPGSPLDQRPYLQDEADASSWPVLTAVGRINGMAVCAIVQDEQIHPAGMDSSHWRQVQLAISFACDRRLPVVAVFDGSPTQLAGGLQAWSAISHSVGAAAACPAPKLALVVGENTGPIALLTGVFDAVIMARGQSTLTLTDATIANRITHTSMQEDDLGGWKVHAEHTGLADLVCDNEVMGIRSIRRLLQYSAESSGWTWPESLGLSHCPGLDTLLPDSLDENYDVRELLREVSDTRSFLEMGAGVAGSLVVGFAPIGGRAVGFVASQNKELAGAIDIQSCRKATRHLRLCSAMGVPVITVVDVPGFVPGHEQESGGLALEVAALLRAYANATVPKITIVIGKALGAAGVALGSRASMPDRIAAWRGASLGLMGAKGVRSLAQRSGADVDQILSVLDVDHAVRGAYVDAVLEPGQTRQWLGETVASLCQSKERRV